MNDENVTLGSLRQKARKKALKERNIQMLRDNLAGMSVRELAKQHGLSAGHVGEIIHNLVWFHFRGSPHWRLPPDIGAQLKELQEALEEEP